MFRIGSNDAMLGVDRDSQVCWELFNECLNLQNFLCDWGSHRFRLTQMPWRQRDGHSSES